MPSSQPLLLKRIILMQECEDFSDWHHQEQLEIQEWMEYQKEMEELIN
jgi:hypothetical protein